MSLDKQRLSFYGVTDLKSLNLRCHWPAESDSTMSLTRKVWHCGVTDPQSLTLWCHWPAEFDSTLSLTLRVWLYGVTDPQSLTLRCQINILIFSRNCNQMRNFSLFIRGWDRIDSRKKNQAQKSLDTPLLSLKYKLFWMAELSTKVYIACLETDVR